MAKSLFGLLKSLHEIQLGSSGGPGGPKIPRKDLTFLLGNLATLVQNGVSLRKAVEVLREEESLQRYSEILDSLQRRLEAGESFSTALAAYPATFSPVIVHQIRIGERSGTVGETFMRIVQQLEKGNQLRATIIKRLSYPLIVATAGVGVVSFMIMFIIPVFKKTYADAKVPLPFITQFLVWLSDHATTYGLLLPVLLIGGIYGYRRARRSPRLACRIDRFLLTLPLLGRWLRDIAVLQFMQVLGTMIESGFKVADALGLAAESVTNFAVRTAISDLRDAVLRGERFSKELGRHRDLFPPVVSQLVTVGEQTGTLPATTRHIREHLERQIERQTEIAVGTIEPILTISLAAAIGGILLAIYLPMFDMIQVVGK